MRLVSLILGQLRAESARTRMERYLPFSIAARNKSRWIGCFRTRRNTVTNNTNTFELKGPNRPPVISRIQKLLPFFAGTFPSDPKVLSAAVEEVTKLIDGMAYWGDVEGIGLAVHEALANAIIHGNHCDPKKGVEICVAVNENCDLLIVVSDSGSGFDPSRVPDPTVGDSVLASRGRGIFFIRQFMDQVDFRFNQGTEVVMRRRRQWLQ